jgi:DNA-binding GntR family transcriptional regulator
MALDARLVILKELARQPDGRLNEALIEKVLDVFGHRRSREWIRTQLNKLGDIGAISVIPAGTVVVASLTRAGLDHVERRAFLDGVARPSLES